MTGGSPTARARYSEALYVEHVAGEAGFQEVTKDMSVGALAYVSVPLADVGKAGHFLAGVSVAGHRQRRHDPGDAALGHRRAGLRQDHADIFRAVLRGKRLRSTTSARSPKQPRASSSTGSSPSGSIPPVHPSSKTNTRSIARRRASVWSAKFPRTWTCSACRCD